MPIPNYQEVMRPLLSLLADGESRSISSIRTGLVAEFQLSADEQEQLLPSGAMTTFQSRVGWAASYLYNAGLLERPKRGTYLITARGKEVLATYPDKVDVKVLSQFEEFAQFVGKKALADDSIAPAGDGQPSDHTPEEQLAAADGLLKVQLKQQLLTRIAEQTPAFFEQLVLDVLTAAGYGKDGTGAQHLGKSGDGGVDGLIREDALGLDEIYVQAKRWENTVGRPEIQQFVGALSGRHASRGVFITTSNFSAEAHAYTKSLNQRVILVDGDELADLMIRHSVGVRTEVTYQIKRPDLDYFASGTYDE